MKMILLAVLSSIVQATAPVPRQAPNHSAASSQPIKKNATSQQQPAASTLPVQKPESAKADQKAGNAPPNTHENVTAIVQQPTSVSGWEKAYVILTGLLVIVGAIGIWIRGSNAPSRTATSRKHEATNHSSQKLRHTSAAGR